MTANLPSNHRLVCDPDGSGYDFFMPRRKIIIFGCGYVGREVAARAVQAGHEVWIHSRNADSLAAVKQVPLQQHIVADLHSDGWHGKLSGDWDLAINLVSSAGGGLDGYRTSYIEGNRSIRRWAAGRGVNRFIYSSATSVYPQSDGGWVTEEDVPEMNNLSANGCILREAECEILESPAFDESIILRLGGIYGPGRHLYLNSLLDERSELPGDGKAYLNLIYLQDIGDAIMRLIEHPAPLGDRIFNLVDDEPAPKQAIVDWLAARIGKPSLRFNPDLAGQRGARRKSSSGMPNRRISNARIKQALAWTPQYPSFREGYTDILSRS